MGTLINTGSSQTTPKTFIHKVAIYYFPFPIKLLDKYKSVLQEPTTSTPSPLV